MGSLGMKSVVFLGLILVTLILGGQSKRVLRRYVLHKERVLSDYRLAEFTVFDSEEKNRLFRLKTFQSDIHSVELRSISSGELVGALEGEWSTKIDNASFTYLDEWTKAWKDGYITPAKHLLIYKNIITIPGRRLVMKNQALMSRTVNIRDEKSNDLLAKFTRTTGWLKSTPMKYKLQVFSNAIASQVYFFAIAVMDHRWMVEDEETNG